MDKFLKFMEEKFTPFIARANSQKHLSAINNGVTACLPLLMVGSIFLFVGKIANFSIEIQEKIFYPVRVTFDLISVLALITITYKLAEKNSTEKIKTVLISISAFFLVMPSSAKFDSILFTSGRGLFVAIFVAIFSTEILAFFERKKFEMRLPSFIPQNVIPTLTLLLRSFLVMTFFLAIKLIFEFTSLENIFVFFDILFVKPFKIIGGSYIGILIVILLTQILWFIGSHGSILTFGFMMPIWILLLDQNRHFFQTGQEIPNIVNHQFVDIFYSMGGSGTTLGLAIIVFFRAKSLQLKEIGKLSLLSGIFNINEPITFGMPIIMNPIMLIPFLLTPIVVVTVTFFAMDAGLVAKSAGIILPWTTPPIIGGYLATGGKISGAVIQIINIALSAIIYYPFFKIMDKRNLVLDK